MQWVQSVLQHGVAWVRCIAIGGIVLQLGSADWLGFVLQYEVYCKLARLLELYCKTISVL